MDIKKYHLTLQASGLRISNDDPLFLLLEQHEKILKDYVEQIQKKYAVNVQTQYRKEERLRQNTAKLYVLAGAIIFIVFVLGLITGSASEFVGFGSFSLGAVIGGCLAIAGMVIAQNITKIDEWY